MPHSIPQEAAFNSLNVVGPSVPFSDEPCSRLDVGPLPATTRRGAMGGLRVINCKSFHSRWVHTTERAFLDVVGCRKFEQPTATTLRWFHAKPLRPPLYQNVSIEF